MLDWILSAVAGAFLLHSLLVRTRADRVNGLRLAAAWGCALGTIWLGGTVLPAVAAVLLAWPLVRRAAARVGLGGPLAGLDVALASEFYRDRERAIWRAAEQADDAAWTRRSSDPSHRIVANTPVATPATPVAAVARRCRTAVVIIGLRGSSINTVMTARACADACCR